MMRMDKNLTIGHHGASNMLSPHTSMASTLDERFEKTPRNQGSLQFPKLRTLKGKNQKYGRSGDVFSSIYPTIRT